MPKLIKAQSVETGKIDEYLTYAALSRELGISEYLAKKAAKEGQTVCGRKLSEEEVDEKTISKTLNNPDMTFSSALEKLVSGEKITMLDSSYFYRMIDGKIHKIYTRPVDDSIRDTIISSFPVDEIMRSDWKTIPRLKLSKKEAEIVKFISWMYGDKLAHFIVKAAPGKPESRTLSITYMDTTWVTTFRDFDDESLFSSFELGRKYSMEDFQL